MKNIFNRQQSEKKGNKMTNNEGIEICCKNCQNNECPYKFQYKACSAHGRFIPNIESRVSRILQLQKALKEVNMLMQDTARKLIMAKRENDELHNVVLNKLKFEINSK